MASRWPNRSCSTRENAKLPIARTSFRLTTLAASFLAALALSLPLAHADAPAAPPEYVASYAVSYRGLDAGTLSFALRRTGGDRYVYETTANPSFLARLVVGRNAVERSELLVDGDGVRPVKWTLKQGKGNSKDDGQLTFDWEAGRVTGIADGQQVDLPVEPRLQDRLSIQVAVMTALARGEEPGTIPLIDDERIKRYSYRRTGTETVTTPFGAIETVVYESAREGSDRRSRFWLAPSLGYVAVRAEQIRKGKVETVMEIRSIERDEAPAK